MTSVRVALIVAALVVGGAHLDDETAAAARVSIIKRYTPADLVAGRYQYVPFEVPPGSGRLEISYQYERANGDNVIDLGLFEPGSLELGSRAFRGYSGGARSSITLDQDTATPGYRAGPLPPGRWHLLLGLYRVRSTGVVVTITIETAASTSAPASSAPPAPPAPPAPAPPAPPAPAPRAPAAPPAPPAPDASPRWFLGALHTHTVHSDGTIGPLDLLRRFRDGGFDFVAITDHNNTTHRAEMIRRDPDSTLPLWIAGEEVTTPSGHASVWGLDDNEWIDFRVRAEDRRIGELVASAQRYGALFSINHPASSCIGCGWDHDIVEGIDAIEISNGRHGEVDQAMAIWDRLLENGRRLTGVGSSDWHRAPSPIEVAHVRVFAPTRTEQAILGAIRSGRVVVMNDARAATPDVVVRADGRSARIGEQIVLGRARTAEIDVHAKDALNGRLVIVSNGRRAAPVPLDAGGRIQLQQDVSPGYMRFELFTADGSLFAITNPVYLVGR